MEEAPKKQLKSIIFASLFWLLMIALFFYLISLITFRLFAPDPIELGTFRLKNGKTFELKSYYGNATESSEFYIEEITNEDSNNSFSIKINRPYNEFVYWRQLNDSLIRLVLKNEKEKDTIYMMIHRENIELVFEPIYQE